MTITRNFKLCLNAGTQNAPYINVNQYDEGEQWIFDLYTEGGQKFTPSTGAIIGIKSDGNAILNSGTVNSDGQVVITETQQMTAASGLAVFELLIEGETHGTANFIVNVERRPSDDAEFSDSDLSMLQEAIDAAEVINEILDEGGDPSEIIEENVNAWLDNHPEATTTVEDGAITAPKINNSLWDKILVNEEASGNPASFDDGADDVPVSSLKVALEPIQTGSGDPSPSNVRPIVAANGKNLFDNSPSNIVEGASIATVNGADISNSSSTAWTPIRYEMTLPAGEYTVSVGKITQSQNNVQIQVTKYSGGTYTEKATLIKQNSSANFITTESETIRISLYSSVANNPFTVSAVMIRLASIADSTYQPYQGIMVERCGKNLCDWNVNVTSSALSISLPAGNYYISASTTISAGSWYIRATDSNGQYSYSSADIGKTGWPKAGSGWSYGGQDEQGISFTVPNGCKLIEIGKLNADGTIPAMLNSGNTAIEYEPYIGTSYPYTLGREVYGGTVDLATGVLTVTHGIVDMGTLTYTYRNSFGMQTNGLSATIKNPSSNNKPVNAISSIAKAGSWTALVNSGTASGLFGVSGGYLGIATTETNPTTFKTAVTGQTICYELVEPQTIQLTPTQVKTLLGYNNISSSGTVDVIYHADTKLYIDKRIAELG